VFDRVFQVKKIKNNPQKKCRVWIKKQTTNK